MDPTHLKSPSRSISRRCGSRLEKATSIAMAAEACADAGNVEKGVEFALDVEQLVYEVNTFLNAANMINRIAKN